MWRIIFHVDMDAFYASVEEALHPSYRGNPVVVGADPKDGQGRGVVLTANYKAREYGIHSGMPISKAYRLCPHAIYVRPHFEKYIEFSKNIMQFLEKYAWKIEVVSIDEAYLDMTGIANNYIEAEKIARKIQREIWETFNLTCSIGIAPNKLLSKIASSTNKPNKITVVHPKDIKSFLFPKPIENLPGVGKKISVKLHELGIHTIGDLAHYDVVELIRLFGRHGLHLHRMANGIDNREVSPKEGRKSIGKEHTFDNDTDDLSLIYESFIDISKRVFEKAKEMQLGFKTIAIKFRYADYSTVTYSYTHSIIITDFNMFLRLIKRLIDKHYTGNKKLRLIGVRISNLVDISRQCSLLEYI